MSFWEGVVLGVVQGATEFLPVSSSGHLVIGQALMGIVIPGVLFEVTVHLATLVSILVAYRERVSGLVRGVLRGDGSSWRYVSLVAVATIPAAVIGLTWLEGVEALFEMPVVVGVALMVTGLLLWSTRTILKGKTSAGLDLSRDPREFGEPAGWKEPALRAAVLIGFAQAFALMPGISRSGSTVVAGLWLGVEPREAAAFSFLMAIPAIGGAAVLQIPALIDGFDGIPIQTLVWASVAAAVTGVLAIRTFVAMLEHRAFHRFALYCWVVGGLFLAYLGLS